VPEFYLVDINAFLLHLESVVICISVGVGRQWTKNTMFRSELLDLKNIIVRNITLIKTTHVIMFGFLITNNVQTKLNSIPGIVTKSDLAVIHIFQIWVSKVSWVPGDWHNSSFYTILEPIADVT